MQESEPSEDIIRIKQLFTVQEAQLFLQVSASFTQATQQAM